MVRAHRISEESTFLGQSCALCKQEFATGDLIVICPEDGSRHHDHCWQANGNHCTAYGCTGQGEIGVGISSPRRRPTPRAAQPTIIPNPAAQTHNTAAPAGSKIRVMPARNFGCARSCLLAATVMLILLIGAACFGIYTLADTLLNQSQSLVPSMPPAVLLLSYALRAAVPLI